MARLGQIATPNEALAKMSTYAATIIADTHVELDMYNKAAELLKIDDLFFKIDLASAVGLLSFLGIPDDKIKEVYLQLISFKEYKSTNDKQYNLYER